MDATQVGAITSAVDFSTILTGVGTVGAAIVVIKVAKLGVNMLLSTIRG